MRSCLLLLILGLAACKAAPDDPAAFSHVCVTSPTGLVECHERD